MKKHYTENWPELKGLVEEIDEIISKVSLPADQVILDDFDVLQLLKISKRKLAQLRSVRKIKFYRTDDDPPPKIAKSKKTVEPLQKGRRKSKIYYFLIDVVNYVKRNPVNPVSINFKINKHEL
jgi:hypothetical protein